MNRLTRALFFSVILLLGGACANKGAEYSEPALIPKPQKVNFTGYKTYTLPNPLVISLPDDQPSTLVLADQINDQLKAMEQEPLEIDFRVERACIKLLLDPSELAKDAYTLSSIPGYGVEITSGGTEGLAYGVQTLRQLILKEGVIPAEIDDAPRFGYRGLMLDVSRHYMPKEFIFRLLDEMQRYKLNRFHWHLTDAGGWRIEIEKYPELTQKAAFRTETDWTKWWVNGDDRKYLDEGTPGAYGGYYTKADAKEIVEYAKDRGITVIPEIEMPGHSEEVLYAYPNLSCSGKALGYESDFCVGNEETYAFLQNVLDEIMEIFPSDYIHIGGDEAGKRAWKTCPKCNALMKKEKMTNVDELQSYLIHRIEQYLNSKGRQIIGWDEILDGGLAPNATVMSWRGEEGGIAAAKAGHYAIMTPGSHLYFDHYQADPEHEPEAIGGFTPIKKTYSYNPVPSVLTQEQSKYILGVQANLWTEYIKNVVQAEYMIFPRLLALSEVAWTQPEHKNWPDFRERVNIHVPQLIERDINSFPLSYDLESSVYVDQDNHTIYAKFDSERWPVTIHYRMDGEKPTIKDPVYTIGDSIAITDSATIVAAIFDNDKLQGRPTKLRVDYHKGIGKKVEWESPIRGGYYAGGAETALLDGYRGGVTYLDGRWLGNTSSTTGVIDLGEETEITFVSTKCMHLIGPWVHMPKWVEVYTSIDGINYESIGRVDSETDQEDPKLRFETFNFHTDKMARYIKIHYEAAIPDKFMFMDEIIIW